MGERPADHPEVAALVDADRFAAGTEEFTARWFIHEPTGDSFFMAPYHMSGTNFIISPEFVLTGGTVNS